MQIDPIEVFDLVHLLGLRGHGSYGKKFCNYFSTWHLNYQGCIYPMTFYPDIFDENASLQLMSFGNPLFEEMLKASPLYQTVLNRTLWGGLFSLFHEFTLL